jgi:hypothetical protein
MAFKIQWLGGPKWAMVTHWSRVEKIISQTEQRREDEKQIIRPAGSYIGGKFGAGLCQASSGAFSGAAC